MNDNNSKKIVNLISKFRDTRVLVLGDLILDHYIWGQVNRISPEAPVVVVEVTEESKRLGGAGNVVSNLRSLGAEVAVCGVVGDDQAGQDLLSLFKQSDVNTDGVIVDKSRPTTIKTRVIARHQQVVRVDKETKAPLENEYYDQLNTKFVNQLGSVNGVIVSDYAKGVVSSRLFDQIRKSSADGVFGIEKCPILIDPKDPNFGLYSSVTVIKPNRKEAQEASGVKITNRSSAIEAGRKLLNRWNTDIVLITLGEDGMVLVGKDDKNIPTVEIDTVAREVFDVSGAGDTVAAVMGLGLAVGATPSESAELANYAAGIVVGEVGTVSVSSDELLKAALRGGL